MRDLDALYRMAGIRRAEDFADEDRSVLRDLEDAGIEVDAESERAADLLADAEEAARREEEEAFRHKMATVPTRDELVSGLHALANQADVEAQSLLDDDPKDKIGKHLRTVSVVVHRSADEADAPMRRLAYVLSVAYVDMDELMKEFGGCDHSVGICMCDLVNAVEDAKTLLVRLKEHYRDELGVMDFLNIVV